MTYRAATPRTSDEVAIRALERAYDAAWTAGDVERAVAAFAPGAVVVNPNGQMVSGLAELRAALQSLLSGAAAATTHTSTVTSVHFVTADVAIVDGEATIQGASLSDGRSAPPLTHSFTDVLVKCDGAWRISQVRAYVFMPQLAPDDRLR